MGCVQRSAAVGGWAAGFPPGKWPSPSPSLFETLNRNRRQGAPGREAAPARISLPGGAAMTHPLPPAPRFLVCVSLPGRMAALPRQPRRRRRCYRAHTPGALRRPGFLEAKVPASSGYPALRLRPLPEPAPFPTRAPGASSPPPPVCPGGEGGGPRRGCDSSRPDLCQLQPRFSARCQLALSFGTEGRLGVPCRWGLG